jgi:hypothetical protein
MLGSVSYIGIKALQGRRASLTVDNPRPKHGTKASKEFARLNVCYDIVHGTKAQRADQGKDEKGVRMH